MERDIKLLCQTDHSLSPLRRLIRDKHCEGEISFIACAAPHGDIIPQNIDTLVVDPLSGDRDGCVGIPVDFHFERACEMSTSSVHEMTNAVRVRALLSSRFLLRPPFGLSFFWED